MTDQRELFGLVASVPTTWRMLSEIAAGGPRAQARITRAVNAARRSAWAGIEARHGAIPGIAVADGVLEQVICIGWTPPSPWRTHLRRARSRITSSEKAIITCWRTATTPARDWPGCCSAGSNTVADHLQILDAAITAVPAKHRRRLMVTCDGAAASHGLIEHLDELARRPGRQLTYSVGWDRMRCSQARRLVPSLNWWNDAYARA